MIKTYEKQKKWAHILLTAALQKKKRKDVKQIKSPASRSDIQLANRQQHAKLIK